MLVTCELITFRLITDLPFVLLRGREGKGDEVWSEGKRGGGVIMGVNLCSTTGGVTVAVETVICWEPKECIVCCVGIHVMGC
jgi:hypothetical protein